jgi:signal transduction histidine kinase
LRQVLTNLLGNAVQHGGSPCRIKFSARDEGPDVKVSVHNTGPPIPPEALPTIFDPLMRAPQARERHGSVGLGLYITRAVIIGHGGTIDVSSSAEQGTTFTARLPRKRQPERRA